ncbi:hypothetical protein ABBQ38_013917 [Trebouxia sp. C0009 RCD-2024]
MDLMLKAEQLTARSKTLSQKVATYNQRIVAEGDSLGEEVSLLQKSIQQAKSDAEGAGEESRYILDELETPQMIFRGHGPGGDLRKLLKQKQPSLLAWLLGPRTNVISVRRNESIRLKEEYHAFRDKMGVIMFVIGASLSLGLHNAQLRSQAHEAFTLTPPFMVGVQVFLCWMLYLYTALALRENVLKVNGSSIRPWWIHHHYWSIATCMILLTLPVDSPAVQVCVKKELWWSAFQGGLMLLQNRYQRRRMYTRIALGKNSAMDVVSGESSGGQGQLLILYPLLFALQLLEIWIGGEMMLMTWRSLLSAEGYLDMEAHDSDLRGSRGVFLAGVLTFYMGVLNMGNTLATLYDKQTAKRLARKRSYATISTGNSPTRAAGSSASSSPRKDQ